MEVFTKEGLIQSLIEIRNKGWIKTKRKNNDGGAGNTLEDLLGIEENNLPLPNAAEWELKTQKKGTTALVTIFHMEPSPTAYRFVPSILLPNYGWSHQRAGEKYPSGEMSFRQTIRTGQFSNRGFSINVDRNERKVLVEFNFNKIDQTVHSEWARAVTKNIGKENLTPQPYWGFDDLFHKAGVKLHNCFFVQAATKRINGDLHFSYENIYMLKNFSLERFINAIADGNIYIDFDARTGHNHGTKFRLRKNALIGLYAETKEY